MFNRINLTTIKLGIQYLRQNGMKRFINQLLIYTSTDQSNYKYYIKKSESNKKTIDNQHDVSCRHAHLYGIVYLSCKIDNIDSFLASITAQTYSNWIILLPDLLKDKTIALNKNIFFYSSVQDLFKTNCDYFIFQNENTLPAPNQVYEINLTLNSNPSDIIYYDEDVFQNNKRFDPHFKTVFNYNLLLQYNYIGNSFCVSKTAIQKICTICNPTLSTLLYDILIFAKKNNFQITHISKILNHNLNGHPITDLDLYHKRLCFYFDYYKISAKTYKTEKNFLKIEYDIIDTPLVSIIIPNKDHITDLDNCLRSIQKSTYRNYEVIIVENNSQENETFSYYDNIRYQNVRTIYWNGNFNYSAINNFAAGEANGQYLLFLNNDTEILSSNWIEEMLMYCQQEDVGIVGSLLYYPDYTVQHAGVITGIQGIAGHAHKNTSSKDSGYFNRVHLVQEYSCVTAACMMIKKELFFQANGFDENFKVAFNDIDLCLKIRKLNYSIVYTPYAILLHYESKSRGAEDTPEKNKRFRSEIDLFRKKWSSILEEGDPYYNPNLTLLYEDFSLKRKIEYNPNFSFYPKEQH